MYIFEFYFFSELTKLRYFSFLNPYFGRIFSTFIMKKNVPYIFFFVIFIKIIVTLTTHADYHTTLTLHADLKCMIIK